MLFEEKMKMWLVEVEMAWKAVTRGNDGDFVTRYVTPGRYVLVIRIGANGSGIITFKQPLALCQSNVRV